MLSATLLLPPLFSLYLSPLFSLYRDVGNCCRSAITYCCPLPFCCPLTQLPPTILLLSPPSCCCPALFLVDRLLLVDRGVGIVALHLSTIHYPPSTILLLLPTYTPSTSLLPPIDNPSFIVASVLVPGRFALIFWMSWIIWRNKVSLPSTFYELPV